MEVSDWQMDERDYYPLSKYSLDSDAYILDYFADLMMPAGKTIRCSLLIAFSDIFVHEIA